MYKYNIDINLVHDLEDKSVEIRKKLVSFIYRIGMGHLGGELSMVEIVVALYYHYMNFDPKNPEMENRDRFVLSKGHCSETLYTIFSDLGMYSMDYIVEHFETLNTAKFGMHTCRKNCKGIEVSAGSLGHGLPVAVGMALGARKQKKYWRTYVLIGDGELDEGTNWEAIMAASHFKLGNLTCILDKNQLQMTGPTDQVMNHGNLKKRISSFDWDVFEIDGHDMYSICEVLQSLPPSDPYVRRNPVFIIANTIKGKGVEFMEGNAKWHGGGIAKEQLEEALESIEKNRKVR